MRMVRYDSTAQVVLRCTTSVRLFVLLFCTVAWCMPISYCWAPHHHCSLSAAFSDVRDDGQCVLRHWFHRHLSACIRVARHPAITRVGILCHAACNMVHTIPLFLLLPCEPPGLYARNLHARHTWRFAYYGDSAPVCLLSILPAPSRPVFNVSSHTCRVRAATTVLPPRT